MQELCGPGSGIGQKKGQPPCPIAVINAEDVYIGTETGWLIRGSDTFQTGFRPVSDQFQTSAACRICGVHVLTVSCCPRMHSPCHRIMSDAQSHVGFAECPVRCTAWTEIQVSGQQYPKVVQCWYGSGPVMFMRSFLRYKWFFLRRPTSEKTKEDKEAARTQGEHSRSENEHEPLRKTLTPPVLKKAIGGHGLRVLYQQVG